MSVRRPVVIGWALLVAGGWAATLLLGEPSATAGPGPSPTSGVTSGNPEPGPQPEGSCPTRRPAPTPSAVAVPSLKDVPDEYADGHAKLVVCSYSVARDTAVAR
ncbi:MULTISPECIES: hypothetical protein [unclassified Streptomyces]|uniref:hypothetical protein n=1 Tax=unclassified Streptomyces TaxID=2593676 RepID=UPI00094035AE|nr:hypothetical protein [Streptomyces sp. CB02058]OKI97834.1 hypothetical protein AMK10_03130 [Streptomyces sp. CB02058]